MDDLLQRLRDLAKELPFAGRYGNEDETKASFRRLKRNEAAAAAMEESGARIERLTAEVAQLRAALAAIPRGLGLSANFRWDSDAQHHVPQLLVEFEPVPAGFPNDAKGWADRDALAALLKGQPIGAPIALEHQAELQALSDDAVRLHGEMVKDAARYRWLKSRLLAADFDYMGEGAQVLVFEMPNRFQASADCDKTIDQAMKDTP